jgi:hypothetical protein
MYPGMYPQNEQIPAGAGEITRIQTNPVLILYVLVGTGSRQL